MGQPEVGRLNEILASTTARYKAKLGFTKVWEVWSLDTVCDQRWILISGLRDWVKCSDQETIDKSCQMAVNSGLALEVEASGECVPPQRSEWKNVSMEHKEAACE